VTYQISVLPSARRGRPARFTVQFGVAGAERGQNIAQRGLSIAENAA